jgi:hypothetical protein
MRATVTPQSSYVCSNPGSLVAHRRGRCLGPCKPRRQRPPILSICQIKPTLCLFYYASCASMVTLSAGPDPCSHFWSSQRRARTVSYLYKPSFLRSFIFIKLPLFLPRSISLVHSHSFLQTFISSLGPSLTTFKDDFSSFFALSCTILSGCCCNGLCSLYLRDLHLPIWRRR